MTERAIIDTDPGVDDALALILALRSQELLVEAVVTVGGNVPLEQTTKNALRIIQMVKPEKVPVLAKGRDPCEKKGPIRAESVHGKDGLGDLQRFLSDDGVPLYPDIQIPHDLPSAEDVYLELLGKYPQELTIITLGPLTNLARILEIAPHSLRPKKLIIMGGAIAVPGNVTPVAEFNIYADPEAAKRVLTSGLNPILVSLDVTRKVRLSREQVSRLGEHPDPLCRFLSHATQRALDFTWEREGIASIPLHDPLAVAVAIEPDLVELVPLHVDVETKGEITCGMTVGDRRPIDPRFKARENVLVAMEVDASRALKLIGDRICPGLW
jgi:inosine-uridine nucleoside N-ribohydrolase